MKKIYVAIVSFMLLANVGFAQVVIPTSASFPDNASITAFFAEYPDVTQLDGVSIGGLVSSLGRLNQLTYIGQLEINSQFFLSGLNNVETMDGGAGVALRILSGFDGLNKLTAVTGDVIIEANVSGLNNLNTISRNLGVIGLRSTITSMPDFESLTIVNAIQIGPTKINSINGFNNLISAKRIDIAGNENLTSVSGFSNINALEELLILTNPNLTSISAFSGLQSISVRFWLSDHPSLQTITGFGSLTNVFSYQFTQNGSEHLPNTPMLTSIGSLSLGLNPSLIDLSGLDGLTTINDSFSLESNSALTTVAHLGKLTTVRNNFSVVLCNSLVNFSGSANPQLDGLNNLTTVGVVVIDNNAVLTSLSGLGNINAGTINTLAIRSNPLLTNCAIKSVCDKIALQNSPIFISGNSTDCNSVEEVANICSTLKTSDFDNNKDAFTVYPNPMNTVLNIENTVGEKIKQISIYNSLGQVVYRVSDASLGNTLALNVAHLQSGIYLAEIVSDKGRVVKKVIKN